MFPYRLLLVAFLFLSSGLAWAGMPKVIGLLKNVAGVSPSTGELRLENLSFFLMGFLLAALGVKIVWNFLARDWPRLPKLNYRKALAMVFLWSLLFILVLTMISGARELMTPGAWKLMGTTYQLREDR